MQTGGAALRSRVWWDSGVALAGVSLALTVTLLAPRLFSDPVGVDPYVLRLSAVAVVLAAVSLAMPGLERARPVLLAVAATTAAFSVFAGGPQWVVDLSGNRFDGNAQILLASAGETVLTVALAVVVLRSTSSSTRPWLRLRRFGSRAWVLSAAGVAVLLAVVLLLPATLLGRQGIAPVALARDLPLAAPACILQSLTQELQFRGLLMGALDRVSAPWVANVVQAAFFGLAHIAVQYQGPADAFVPVTIALGLAFGWMTQRTGSIWPAVIIHAVADIAVTVGVIPGLYGY
jgi:membrane protease YdiL (CAAX protease family)